MQNVHKWAARVSYLGTAYAGWQCQKNAPSVQEEVEKALSFVAAHDISTVCAGRTDAGVHATGQVIHFESGASRTADNWLQGANTQLPETIRIIEVKSVSEHFNARFSAISRTYQYNIFNAAQLSPIWCQHAAHVKDDLDVSLMHEAAQHLIGEHDFSSFRAAGCQAKHAVREMMFIQVDRKHQFVTLQIKANAFLYHMVRITVEALVQVGKGKRPPFWIKEVLNKQKRSPDIAMMPSRGLYLIDVGYPEDLLSWSDSKTTLFL